MDHGLSPVVSVNRVSASAGLSGLRYVLCASCYDNAGLLCAVIEPLRESL
jgi:hypothetical protein